MSGVKKRWQYNAVTSEVKWGHPLLLKFVRAAEKRSELSVQEEPYRACSLVQLGMVKGCALLSSFQDLQGAGPAVLVSIGEKGERGTPTSAVPRAKAGPLRRKRT